MLEAVVQKGLFYFLNMGNPGFGELIAYTGYKFVVLCPIAIAEPLVGYYGSYAVLGLFGLIFALFFFKTLKRFNTQSRLADHIAEVSLNRKSFQMMNSGAQILLIWLLSFN
jgi:hypothetical protein